MAGPSAAELFDRRDFGGLVELSGSDDPHERHAAIGYLGGLRRRHVDGAVIRALLHDEDEAVRGQAARALSSIGGDAAGAALVEATSSNAVTRAAINAALGVLGDRRGVPKLTAALDDDDARARAAAARALGRLGQREAVGPLGGLLGDESSRVRSRARDALFGIGHRGAADVLLRAPRRAGVLRRLDARATRPSIGRSVARERDQFPATVDRLVTRLFAGSLKALAFVVCLALLDVLVVGASWVGFLVTTLLVGGGMVKLVGFADPDDLLDHARWRAEQLPTTTLVAPRSLTMLRTLAGRPVALAMLLGVPLAADVLLGGWGVVPGLTGGLVLAVGWTQVVDALVVGHWQEQGDQSLLVDAGSDPLRRHRFFTRTRIP